MRVRVRVCLCECMWCGWGEVYAEHFMLFCFYFFNAFLIQNLILQTQSSLVKSENFSGIAFFFLFIFVFFVHLFGFYTLTSSNERLNGNGSIYNIYVCKLQRFVCVCCVSGIVEKPNEIKLSIITIKYFRF